MLFTNVAQVLVDRDFVATEVLMKCNVPPSGSYLEVDILCDGVSIFGSKPGIGDSATTKNRIENYVHPNISKNSILSLSITHVGSVTPGGSDLMVTLLGY
jgi:hypothetical protein